MRAMHLRLPFAHWLRRGLEAGFLGALLSVATLVAFRFSRPDPHVALPHGLDGAMILVPAILALGVFAISYPTFLAATRGDAVLGGLAAFLVAADVLMAISLATGASVWIRPLSRDLPLGTLAAALAVPAGLAGLLVGQLTAPLGFGRLAGIRTALSAGAVALLLAVVGAYFS
jgi:hypothetical protein